MERQRSVLVALTVALALGSYFAYAQTAAPNMSFFITSAGPGDGANLGGLLGADRHCTILAARAGASPDTNWQAYLSTQSRPQQPAIHARNRIGIGPWYNSRGQMVAKSVDDLHSDSNMLGKEMSLTEMGTVVNGRGDTPNMHDILTGSDLQGMAIDGDEDTTCNNWTSNGAGSAMVGHHDKQGGGANPNSWNSAHGSKGCSQENLQGTGGNGLYYCFATN